jgi:putative NADH-flavin reductase
MTITIFGATGRTGMQVIQKALESNIKVKTFVRNPAKLQQYQTKVEVITGSIDDYSAIKQAIQNSDCVVNVLGHSKNTPKDMQTTAIKNIIKAMQELNVARLITLTGAGVFAKGDKADFVNNVVTFILKTFLGSMYYDGVNSTELVTKSNLNWTVLRAPVLTNGEKTNRVELSMVGDKKLSFKISRKDLADKLINIIKDPSTFKKLPYIAQAK